MDVQMPIKRKMKIKKAGGEWRWLKFKYERLPMFCFFCGIIGLSDSFCEKRFESPKTIMEMPYGTWLKATSELPASSPATGGYDSRQRTTQKVTRMVGMLEVRTTWPKREGGFRKWKCGSNYARLPTLRGRLQSICSRYGKRFIIWSNG